MQLVNETCMHFSSLLQIKLQVLSMSQCNEGVVLCTVIESDLGEILLRRVEVFEYFPAQYHRSLGLFSLHDQIQP